MEFCEVKQDLFSELWHCTLVNFFSPNSFFLYCMLTFFLVLFDLYKYFGNFSPFALLQFRSNLCSCLTGVFFCIVSAICTFLCFVMCWDWGLLWLKVPLWSIRAFVSLHCSLFVCPGCFGHQFHWRLILLPLSPSLITKSKTITDTRCKSLYTDHTIN